MQYQLDDVNIAAGTYGKAKATGTVTVTSIAKPGYEFPVTPGPRTTWTYSYSAGGGVTFAVEDSSTSVAQGGVLTTPAPVVSGQSGAITYAFADSSAVSALGWSLNASTEVISGTIGANARLASYVVKVTATDAGSGQSATYSVTVEITGSRLVITGSPTSSTQGGVLQTDPPTVSGKSGALTYELTGSEVNATDLAALGLSLNATTGVIAGAVGANAAPGSYDVTVKASDAGDGETATFTVAITIEGAPLKVASSSASAAQGALLSTAAPEVTGRSKSGAVTYAIDDSSGVSQSTLTSLGLALNSSTGVISGQVLASAAPGTYVMPLKAFDDGDGDTATFTVTITITRTLMVESSSASVAQGGVLSTEVPVVTGKSGSVSFAIDGSSSVSPSTLSGLGLTLDPSTGVIFGRVDANGAPVTYVVGLRATDDLHNESATFTVTLTITGSPLRVANMLIAVPKGKSLVTDIPVVTGRSGELIFTLDDCNWRRPECQWAWNPEYYMMGEDELTDLEWTFDGKTGVISGPANSGWSHTEIVRIFVWDPADNERTEFTITFE